MKILKLSKNIDKMSKVILNYINYDLENRIWIDICYKHEQEILKLIDKIN